MQTFLELRRTHDEALKTPSSWSIGPPLFLDQNEARVQEKIFCENGPSPYLRVWMTTPLPSPPPLPEGMDPLLTSAWEA